MRKGKIMLRQSVVKNIRQLAVILGGALCVSLPVTFARPISPQQEQTDRSDLERVVPYVPTPHKVVEKMLEFAQVGPNDVVYDLGSGDGRIVIMAAQKFGAQAVGVELNGDLYKQSSDRIAELGLQKRAKILHENMFDVSVRPATVVTLYLLTIVNEKLRPTLEKQLRPGTRVVSHDFKMPGWLEEKTVTVTSENGLPSTLYLYVLPQREHR